MEAEVRKITTSNPIKKIQTLQQPAKQISPSAEAAADIDDFNNMSENKVDSSLMSEHGMSEFGDLPQQEDLGSSMMSNQKNESMDIN